MKRSYVTLILLVFLFQIMLVGCASKLVNRDPQRGDLLKTEQKEFHGKQDLQLEMELLPNRKAVQIKAFSADIVKTKQRKIYKKRVTKELDLESITSETAEEIFKETPGTQWYLFPFAIVLAQGYWVEPVFGIPYSLVLYSMEGETVEGKLNGPWNTVRTKINEASPRQTSLEVGIPEIDYVNRLKTDSEGRASIFVPGLPEADKLRQGFSLTVKSDFKGKTYSAEKHFSSKTVTALIEKSPHPPRLTFDLDFQDQSGDGVLNAGEEGLLFFKINNEGKGDAFGVKLALEPEDWVKRVQLPKVKNIGRIQESENKEVKINIKAQRSVPTSRISFQAKLKEEFGFDSDPKIVRLQTEKFHNPKLKVTDFGIDDRNQNALVEPMEVVKLTARVKNAGKGKAKNAMARVKFGSNVFLAPESRKEFSLEDLAPGEEKDISFSFIANKRIEAGEKLPININLKEDRAEFEKSYPLDISMNAPQRRVEETVIAAKDPSSKESSKESSTSLSVEVDKNIPEGSFADSNDIALLIGNRHYDKHGVPDVDYAYRDLNVFKRYLEKTMGFERIFVVKDATQGDFNTWFGTGENPQGRLYNLVRSQESRVFVYYVGHGAPGVDTKKNYFVPVDANPDYVESSGYPVSRFYSNLKSLDSQELVVVLDACFSGKTQEGMLFDNVSPAQLMDTAKHDADLSEGVVMSSAQEDELSVWYPEKKHSLFTYYFLKGLRGEADKNGDSKITSGEIMKYVSDHVPYKAQAIANRSQHPALNGDKEVVLTHLK